MIKAILAIMATLIAAQAMGDSVTFSWQAPTHRYNVDGSMTGGAPLTAAEIAGYIVNIDGTDMPLDPAQSFSVTAAPGDTVCAKVKTQDSAGLVSPDYSNELCKTIPLPDMPPLPPGNITVTVTVTVAPAAPPAGAPAPESPQ